jgi:MOSC domain-containing protein YiiM
VSAPVVEAVSRSAAHDVRKDTLDVIRLVEGLGVEGDAHLGVTVQHLSRIRRDPTQPNLRQVHLIHGELHDELRGEGFGVAPGQMGENITTRGVDLLGLAHGTRLHLGPEAIVEVTGLRNPCRRLNELAEGLMAACLDHAEDGSLVRKAGILGIVVRGGEVRPGDAIVVEAPAGEPRPLAPV